MAALVTLENVKKALRIDFDDDDAILSLYIDAASESVVSYLKDQADELIPAEDDVDGEVPAAIQTATIMLVGQFYRSPDANADNAFTPGYLPAPVTALLYPLRDPALK